MDLGLLMRLEPKRSLVIPHESANLPGSDVLYLPAWWWHQFEQPFEDTAALNLWSFERPPGKVHHSSTSIPPEGAAPDAPDGATVLSIEQRDTRLQEHFLYDNLEALATKALGAKAGVALEALALERAASSDGGNGGGGGHGGGDLARESAEGARLVRALEAMAEKWKASVQRLPSAHPAATRPASELVDEFLELGRRDLLTAEGASEGWAPGVPWDLSELAPLEPELEARCRPAPPDATFASVCAAPDRE